MVGADEIRPKIRAGYTCPYKSLQGRMKSARKFRAGYTCPYKSLRGRMKSARKFGQASPAPYGGLVYGSHRRVHLSLRRKYRSDR